MEQLSSVQGMQPAFQSKRVMPEQTEIQRPREITDGNKKIVNALVGLAAISAGGVVLYKTGALTKLKGMLAKNKETVQKATNDLKSTIGENNITARGQKITELSQEIQEQVPSLSGKQAIKKSEGEQLLRKAEDGIKNLKESVNKTIAEGDTRTVYKTKDGLSVMMSKDGGAIESIEKVVDGSKTRFNYAGGKLTCIREGLETVEENGKATKIADAVYDFTGKGTKVTEGAIASVNKATGKTEEISEFAKRSTFKDGNTTLEKLEINKQLGAKKGETKYSAIFEYANGKPTKVSTAVTETAKGNKAQHLFEFSDGNVKKYVDSSIKPAKTYVAVEKDGITTLEKMKKGKK